MIKRYAIALVSEMDWEKAELPLAVVDNEIEGRSVALFLSEESAKSWAEDGNVNFNKVTIASEYQVIPIFLDEDRPTLINGWRLV